MLSDQERLLLRRVAIDALHAELSGTPPEVELPATGPLTRPGSAFVTLKNRGRLRGCIGLVGHRQPLARCVREAARRSLGDSPFSPVLLEELPELDLELSVLTEFETITDMAVIEVGRHGLVVSASGRSGLLLPQVASEREWDREAFLAHACLKAGLGPEDWRRPDLRIEVFEAEVF